MEYSMHFPVTWYLDKCRMSIMYIVRECIPCVAVRDLWWFCYSDLNIYWILKPKVVIAEMCCSALLQRGSSWLTAAVSLDSPRCLN